MKRMYGDVLEPVRHGSLDPDAIVDFVLEVLHQRGGMFPLRNPCPFLEECISDSEPLEDTVVGVRQRLVLVLLPLRW